MNRQFGDCRYESSRVQDCKDGFAGFELHRQRQDTTERVAAVIFWDASGQFFVETFGTDVHLEILEELIAEAKASIKSK